MTRRVEHQNSDLIEATADKIIADANEMPDIDIGKLKKDIAECERKISNATAAILNGVDSPALKEVLKNEENKKTALNLKVKAHKQAGIDRAGLISKMKANAASLISDVSRTKELVQKYIGKIEITDEGIKYSPPVITTTGCRTRIRTQTNRVRVCRATFTQSGNIGAV